MPEVLIDTNFILNCIENKVDFLDRLREMGFNLLIPVEIIHELEKISKSQKKLHFREDARLAIKILNKAIDGIFIKKIELGIEKGEYADDGIIRFLKKNSSVYLATMDKALKNKVSNSRIVLRAKKKIAIV